MTKVKVVLNHGTLVISGELSRHSVEEIQSSDYGKWFVLGAVNIDLSYVTKVDSAGLAWLFYLLEQATEHSCQLCFSHIPEKLTKLIKLSGVEGFLPLTCD